MHKNYIEVLGQSFPKVQASCIGDPSDYSSLKWEAGDPLPTQAELDAKFMVDVKNQIWLKIKAKRDSIRQDGVKLASNDKFIHSDDTSRIQQIGLVLMGQNIPPNLMWKFLDNTFVLMTPSLAQEIFVSIATNDTNVFKVAEQHKAAMYQSEDPESYNYDIGWPMSYTAYLASQTA